MELQHALSSLICIPDGASLYLELHTAVANKEQPALSTWSQTISDAIVAVTLGCLLGGRASVSKILISVLCDQVIIFGTDVPGLKQDAFEAAVGLLDSHDLVFGPARDGGYYMVGMKDPHAAIFHNVDWSTAAVLSTSVAIAQHHGLAVPVPLGLPQLTDIDVIKVRPICALC